jgi:hypothetical protein
MRKRLFQFSVDAFEIGQDGESPEEWKHGRKGIPVYVTGKFVGYVALPTHD